ncbi:restriction endonuclease subunit S [Listeria monocytogenes]|nr:restriction endonuclease subunit S [Listeria monocytogenes]EHD5594309.1 restriction endonuclease subunit S [Listeria monocytogenes]EHD5643492.1 restriction endonuclease subunit S [Listeria monocytogenes]
MPLFYVISHYSNLPFRAWEQRELGELMNVKSVKRIHQSDWTDKGIRFLRARDIVSASKGKVPSEYLYISRKIYEEYSKISGKVENGDLLVTGVGSIGIPMLINHDEPLYFKDGNIIWFQNMKYINGEFFYYSFISYSIQKFIRDSAGTGTVGTYTIDSGRKTPIYLSNNNEQEKIGSFFKLLDNTIALHQRKLDALKLMKKGFLQQMFPKRGENIPKIRLDDFDDIWEERILGEFLKESKIKGSNGSLAKKLTVKLWRKGVVPKEEIYTGSSATQYYIRKTGQFIYGKLDFLNQAFGIIPLELDGYESTLDSPAFDIEESINETFLLEYVSLVRFYKYQGNIANGSRRAKRIHTDTFFEMPIPLPNSNEQQKIGTFSQQIDDLIALQQNKLEKISSLKRFYLKNMFI